MNKIMVILALSLSIAGCKDFMDGTQRAGYNIRKEVVKTSNRVSDYFRVEEKKPEPKRQVMAPRYCYKVLTDVVCYRNPQPGAENRLVGYYEPPAQDASVLAASDSFVVPPAQQVYVKPLPVAGGGTSEQNPQPLIRR